MQLRRQSEVLKAKETIKVIKILITGSNSYIGENVTNWLMNSPTEYEVYEIDMVDGSWRKEDFSKYDVVFHVAGIAHVSTDSKMEGLYYKVNRDLAIETANKAKKQGVRQFIFMSSIIVYGDSSNINHKRIINKNTIPTPSNFYGKSKLQGEEGIIELQDHNFNVVIVRPPMIFGKNSKGNYPKLSKLARKMPIFPDINNERSMLHIDNFCEFIKLMIDNNEKGIFYPQNSEYVSTSELVKLISQTHGKDIKLTKIFNGVLKLMGKKIGIINKVFGNLVYDMSMSEYKENYRVVNLKEAVKKTENKVEN